MSEVVSIIDAILCGYSSCPENPSKRVPGNARGFLPSSQGLGQFLQSANDTGTPAASSAACICSGSSAGLSITATSRLRRFIVERRVSGHRRTAMSIKLTILHGDNRSGRITLKNSSPKFRIPVSEPCYSHSHPHSFETNGVTRSYTSAFRPPCSFGLDVLPMSRPINARPPPRRSSSSPAAPRPCWLG